MFVKTWTGLERWREFPRNTSSSVGQKIDGVIDIDCFEALEPSIATVVEAAKPLFYANATDDLILNVGYVQFLPVIFIDQSLLFIQCLIRDVLLKSFS